MTPALTKKVRVFQNTRMFDSPEEAAEYLATVWPLSARGYVGPDGTVRLMVELDTRTVKQGSTP